jgi:hypothetical protein
MDEACRRIAKLVDDAWRDEFANSTKAEEPAEQPIVLPAGRKITA